MSIEFIRPTPDEIPELGRIIFQAFEGISNAHHFPLDIPDVSVATMLAGGLVMRPDFHGIMAVERDGPAARAKILGLNFVQTSDAVGGVGPLCVDPASQSRGVGKRLMQLIVEWSLQNHGPMVRLLQDTFNMTSLSLYTSLGYTLREPIVLLSIPPASADDTTVRPLTAADLDACESLCRDVYKVSRRNELAVMIEHGAAMGCIPQGRFVDGQLRAYIIPGFFGYAVALTPQDLLDTAQQTARTAPPLLHRIMIPARNADLFPAALARGFKSIKMLLLMSIGPYESPTAAWAPSIAY